MTTVFLIHRVPSWKTILNVPNIHGLCKFFSTVSLFPKSYTRIQSLKTVSLSQTLVPNVMIKDKKLLCYYEHSSYFLDARCINSHQWLLQIWSKYYLFCIFVVFSLQLRFFNFIFYSPNFFIIPIWFMDSQKYFRFLG